MLCNEHEGGKYLPYISCYIWMDSAFFYQGPVSFDACSALFRLTR